jgi:hypothetical protein
VSSKLKDLEKRLKDEPDNLGLRVTLAGALREAGRVADAVELYRSVAIAYRDHGRSQQAIAVCRSILEIAPDDARCHGLLATLIASHKARTAQEVAAAAATTPGMSAFGDDAVLEVGTPPPHEKPTTLPPLVPREKPPSIPPLVVSPSAPAARGQTGPVLDEASVPALPRTVTPQAIPPTRARTIPPSAPPMRSPTKPPPPPPPKSTASALLAPRIRDTPTPAALKAALTLPRGTGRTPIEGTPATRSSNRLDETPLPVPLPYHEADPTTRSLKKLSQVDVLVPAPDPDESDGLPMAEDAKTRPGDDDSKRLRHAEGSGLSKAARRISEALIKPSPLPDDLSLELDTRQRPRIESAELEKITRNPPTVPVERLEEVDDDEETGSPADTRNLRAQAGDSDTEQEEADDADSGGVPTLTDEDQDEVTRPRDSPLDLLIRTENEGAFGTAFFQPLPAEHRRAVLERFHKKSVKKGTTVIRQGEVGHSLVVVLKGQLVARVDRKGGPVELGAVGTGEFVGEGSLLARGPSQVQVSAATDCELLLLAPRDFYETAGAFPALWAELKDVAERRKRDLEMSIKRG